MSAAERHSPEPWTFNDNSRCYLDVAEGVYEIVDANGNSVTCYQPAGDEIMSEADMRRSAECVSGCVMDGKPIPNPAAIPEAIKAVSVIQKIVAVSSPTSDYWTVEYTGDEYRAIMAALAKLNEKP